MSFANFQKYLGTFKRFFVSSIKLYLLPVLHPIHPLK